LILPDHEIFRARANGTLGIDPFGPEKIQPASYDLSLDKYIRYYPYDAFASGPFDTIDPKSPARLTTPDEIDDEGLVLGERQFLLASTVEKIRMPSHLVGRVEGKSSLARMGLFVHVTAGFIDPGFEGHITLELFNANHFGIKLYPNMPIAQISFERLSSPAEKPYGSKGLGSKYGNEPPGPVESAYYRNFQ
jgi:dCTP deaminase